MIAYDALARLGMREAAMVPLRELTADEQSFVLLSAALARKPRLIVVDVPGFMEARHPPSLLGELAKFVSEGGACLFACGVTVRPAGLEGRDVVIGSRAEAV